MFKQYEINFRFTTNWGTTSIYYLFNSLILAALPFNPLKKLSLALLTLPLLITSKDFKDSEYNGKILSTPIELAPSFLIVKVASTPLPLLPMIIPSKVWILFFSPSLISTPILTVSEEEE